MSFYSTPLQFSYFFSLLIALLLWYRGNKQERLSDGLLGWVMFILAMELQDYTFGFSGINYLWEEMNGFPRSVALLFGPIVYFYLKSQTNRSFRLQAKHALHLLPWGINFLLLISFFVQGPEKVQSFQASSFNVVWGYVYFAARIVSYSCYFYLSLKLYRAYRDWSKDQFSNQELISFLWFRNFIYVMIFWIGFREIVNIFDHFLDLSFYQDWWWNLALAAVAIYVGLSGYAQKQSNAIVFDEEESPTEVSEEVTPPKAASEEETLIAERIQKIMEEERLFLQAELSLGELAKHLKVNTSLLSATINKAFGLNFNDYINSLRIAEFEARLQSDDAKQFTLLSLAYDSGFNSKSTFNRAFKKLKGVTPRAYLDELQG